MDPTPSTAMMLSLFQEVARGAPIVITAFDLSGQIILHIGKGLEKLGLQQNQLVGMSVFDAFAGADEALTRIRAAIGGETSSNTQVLGETVWDNWFNPIRDAAGQIVGAVSISTDVTERERARVELERRLELIEVQTQAIRTMEAPIIQVWEGVLVVPLVGELDAQRTAAVMDRLLVAITTTRARFAILDLTGVEKIDTQTADQVLRVVGAVALLGVKGVISGVRPAVAEALIDLGVDLSRVATLATLHDALRRCMGPSASAPRP